MFKWLQDKLPTVMDELDRFTRAEEVLNERGTLPPVVPNRMQCAPNPMDMLEAFNTGMDLGASITDNTPRPETQTMDQFVDSMGASLFMVSAQLWKDTKNLQHCMDKQDEKHEAEMKEYIEQVKAVAEEQKPAYPKYQRGTWQYAVDYNRVCDERHRKGMCGITCWEYDAIVNQGLDPTQPGGLANVENSVLCPSGGKNNSQGYGAHGGRPGADGGGGGEGTDRGPSSGGGGGGGGGGDLMNIVIDCDGKGTQSNGDGTSSCKP